MNLWQIILSVVGVAMVLFFVSQLFQNPMKVIGFFVRSALIGCAGIYIINLLGQNFHLHIGFNWITAAVAGVLGIPGLIALVVIKMWFLASI
ncbi:pro-sigmaK processing inhibitor BofA family protein [Fodinisporobacter ferrooxydans]|uniref:Pro-sigmaK processing inhibitor BofA family protein n=1 Tax=Fodinisporobacter ferrooxydans TaxID=2901836 RepID=A0ABY4CNE2_9BACL|nr:pro-sigmaK processing inhibitor BofA family protein [Alicyclobacillaceae bacterium MYW30-H2]